MVCCIQETHLTCKDTHRLKIKGWSNTYQANRKQKKKKAGVAILISDKVDIKPTNIKRNKEGHYIIVKGSMQQEELTILNIYTPRAGCGGSLLEAEVGGSRSQEIETILVNMVKPRFY